MCSTPKRSSSSGTGGASAATTLSAEAITTKRAAAAATIFSRVWAPPPPLTSQPARVDLVGAVDRDVELAELVERLDVKPERARRRSVAGEVATQRSPGQPALGERRQQVGDGAAGARARRACRR